MISLASAERRPAGQEMLILLLGVAIDQIIFAPLERSVLRRRGLAGT